ncbi:IS1 family transposase [Winogradskyella sp.]|uniref:IS1 family transposase n=1 Tax=Winogradskyella sp. TaxID=1883156 RepID=UPI003BA9CEA0
MNCNICKAACVKNGFQANGKQRYRCKACKHSQQANYSYKACAYNANQSIKTLLLNSCGITDISRVLSISRNTIKKRILAMGTQIKRPMVIEVLQSYEMDELSVRINGKWCYIAYAINRKTKQVIDFVVGGRTNKNLMRVVNKLLDLNPKCIYTDGLLCYKTLIPREIHSTARNQTNRIERYHLNLRTHLKRLHRKTICYSKSLELLSAILKIYFWHSTELKTA